MKRILTCLLLAGSVSTQAQVQRFLGKTALEEITADKFLAAGNMTDYAMPVKTLQQAKFAGKLTPLGNKVLAKLDSMQNTTTDRL